MIGKYLDICTSHLTMDTVNKLCENKIPYTTAYPYEEGLFLIVPSSTYEPNNIKRPNDLNILLNYAKQHDCSIVRLDRDADEINELTTYEWP